MRAFTHSSLERIALEPGISSLSVVLVGTAFPLLYSASGVTLRADPTSVSGLVVRARLNRSSTEVGSAPSPSWSVSKQDVCVGVLVGEEDRVIRLWTPPFLCVPSARNGRFLGTKCKSDHFPRLSTLTCAPAAICCRSLHSSPLLTPPLLFFFFSFSFHTLSLRRPSQSSFIFIFFAPFMIGHMCLSEDRPRVVLGDVALRKRRDPVLIFFSNRCMKRRGKRTVCGV